jgi:hypothetical protein
MDTLDPNNEALPISSSEPPPASSQSVLTVTTDKADYAPGEDVILTVEGVTTGSSVEIQIADAAADPGDDGDADTYAPLTITDGGTGDLDGIADGRIMAAWTVPTDGNAVNATLDVKVTDAGRDSTFGTGDDQVATTSFTDSAGAYSIKWLASDPAANRAPFAPTYDKLTPQQYLDSFGSYPTGRATLPATNGLSNSVAYASPPTSSNLDAVTSLAPKDMALGQIVPFQIEITVNGSILPENGTITINPFLLTKTTSGDDFGFDPAYGIIAAFVDAGDPGTSDPGTDASVDNFTWAVLQPGTSNEQISTNIQVSGLHNGDKVIVEV